MVPFKYRSLRGNDFKYILSTDFVLNELKLIEYYWRVIIGLKNGATKAPPPTCSLIIIIPISEGQGFEIHLKRQAFPVIIDKA